MAGSRRRSNGPNRRCGPLSITGAILGRVAAAIERPEPALRAALAGSALVGLAMVRYVVRVEPIASADAETLVRTVVSLRRCK